MRSADEVAATLAAWGLTGGQDVEVELLVNSGSATLMGPRYVEGIIEGATDNVLLVKSPHHEDRVTRIAWQAVATIRDRVTPHPAL